jgi:hypothetical protein
LPSRTLGSARGVGLQVLVDGVADLPLEGAQRCFAGLALGDLLVVVGAAAAVLVATWVTAAMWIAWFRRRFPRIDRR